MKIASLVSRRRTYRLDSSSNELPSNVFWGLKELVDQGSEITELGPTEKQSRIAKLTPLIGDYLDFLFCLIANRRTLSNSNVIFTYVLQHAIVLGLLRRLGIVRTPSVHMMAGFQFLTPKGGLLGGMLKKSRIAFEKWCLQGNSRMVVVSEIERNALQKGMPAMADRILFCKFGTDSSYYKPAPGGKEPLIVSVGNDMDRDWKVFFDAMQKAEYPSLAILPDRRFKGLKTVAGMEVLIDPPMSRTKEILAQADIVVITTRPGQRFSGITTALCSAQCKCLVVYDKVEWLSAYGFEHRLNYIGFKQGDAVELANILTELRENPQLIEEVAERGYELGTQLTIANFSQQLAELFRELDTCCKSK